MFGLIGAMEDEIAGIRAALSDVKEAHYAGLTFYTGTYHAQSCVLVRAGVGKVNAALCTQALIDHFPVTAVINTGIAGGLDSRLQIGDLVLCTDAVEHDMDAVSFGYAPGQIPQMDVFSFSASAPLRALAKEVAAELLPELSCLEGRILTGDQFVSSHEKKAELIRTFDGACCEMEGAAIAHVCHMNGLPFLIVRAISDNADNAASIDYPTFEKAAIAHSVKLSLGMLEKSAETSEF